MLCMGMACSFLITVLRESSSYPNSSTIIISNSNPHIKKKRDWWVFDGGGATHMPTPKNQSKIQINSINIYTLKFLNELKIIYLKFNSMSNK